MKGLLDKSNTPPVRVVESYAKWSIATVLMYLIARFIFPRNIGELDSIGITVGVFIGFLWSFTTLIRAFLLAKKGIFVEKRNKSCQWRLIGIIIEILIPFSLGYCILLLAEANKIDFNFYDAVWSLIYSVFFTFFFTSGIGYYLIEWHFGREFFDKPDT